MACNREAKKLQTEPTGPVISLKDAGTIDRMLTDA